MEKALEQSGRCSPDTDGEAKTGPDTTYLVQNYIFIVTYHPKKSKQVRFGFGEEMMCLS